MYLGNRFLSKYLVCIFCVPNFILHIAVRQTFKKITHVQSCCFLVSPCSSLCWLPTPVGWVWTSWCSTQTPSWSRFCPPLQSSVFLVHILHSSSSTIWTPRDMLLFLNTSVHVCVFSWSTLPPPSQSASNSYIIYCVYHLMVRFHDRLSVLCVHQRCLYHSRHSMLSLTSPFLVRWRESWRRTPKL